jgi:HD-like signal output (HDOD) protein
MGEGEEAERRAPGGPAWNLSGKELPALSPTLSAILDLTARDPFPMAECVRVFETDAGLSARLLRLVNSSYFGLPRRLASVGHAARMLGERAFKGLGASLAAAAAVPRPTTPRFDVELFWRDGLIRALAARETIRSKDGLADEAFAAALLQNLGVAVLAVLFPVEYSDLLAKYGAADVSLSRLESDAFGTSHAEVGAKVVDQWRLPHRTATAIARHHEALASSSKDDPTARLVRAVQLSALIPSAAADDECWKKSLLTLQTAEPSVDWLQLAQCVDAAFSELSMLFLASAGEAIPLAERWADQEKADH